MEVICVFRGKGFGGRRLENLPKPVKEGEEYDVDILEVGSKGDGIAKINNFIVFVPGSKKGEKKHIKIVKVARRFAVAEIKEV
ncbi:MAG: TRAM domain-containing protein [Candidatus Aenigmatarchaeota archaeon]